MTGGAVRSSTKAAAFAGVASDVGSNASDAVGVAVEVAKSAYDERSK